jgi:hypothetical protein
MEEKLAGQSPIFGDRCCELTVIGQRSELDTFVDALRGCFCTQGEIESWRRGERFDDPWPATVTRIRMG